jgi:hypothetical protein
VYCQLEALRHCLPPSVQGILEELPDTLDETYERVLREINKANREHAHRLLQCLTVALRPLRVEELAEVLAIDFDAPAHGGIPQLNPNWQWANHHQAVLSTCSSLIAIVDDGYSKVVQFSHFSVKEYLTSVMCQVPAMRVSERLWCCWVREVRLVVGERPSKSGAPATRGWQRTEGDGNGVGAHASTPLRSTLGPGIGGGIKEKG